MAEKTLIIKAKGGLGNRMLSAVCGLVYADLTHRKPIIDWRDGSYAPLNVNAYPILFDTPITTPVEAFDDDKARVNPAIWTGNLGRTPESMVNEFAPNDHSSPSGYRKFCTDMTRIDQPEDLAVFWCYLPKFPRIAKLMRRDPRFAGRRVDEVMAEYLNRYFTPNARVRETVEGVMAEMGRPMIGVHIRYTDRKIPLDKIKLALRKRLAQKPGASVFLATDNGAVQEEMKAEFPGLRHTQKHLNIDGSRLHWPSSEVAKVQEAENALIDMWLLSRADHLIYSKHSTFSVTSACLGRLKPDQQDDVDRFNLPVVIKRHIQNYT